MREIKFRAWDKDRQRFLEGHELSGCCLDSEGNLFRSDNSRPFNQFEGEPIFLQYTGLKDKNGTEIYEGDLLKWRYITDDTELAEANQGIIRVDFRYGSWRTEVVSGSWPGKDGLWTLIEDADEHNEEQEVIGNIYENKELLK